MGITFELSEKKLKELGVMSIEVMGATPLIPYAIVQIHLDEGAEVEKQGRDLVEKIERDLWNRQGKNGIAFSDISVHCSRSAIVEFCTVAVLNPSEALLKEAPLVTYWSMLI